MIKTSLFFGIRHGSRPSRKTGLIEMLTSLGACINYVKSLRWMVNFPFLMVQSCVSIILSSLNRCLNQSWIHSNSRESEFSEKGVKVSIAPFSPFESQPHHIPWGPIWGNMVFPRAADSARHLEAAGGHRVRGPSQRRGGPAVPTAGAADWQGWGVTGLKQWCWSNRTW